MKKIFCVIITLLCLFNTAFALESSDNNLEMPSSWNDIFRDTPISAVQLSDLSLKDMVYNAFLMIKDKLSQPVNLLARICAVLLLAAIARSICPTDGSGNLYNVLEIIIVIASFSLCANPILQMFNDIITRIEELRIYLSSFVPVFASILTSCGQLGSAAIYSGFFFTAVMMIAGVLCTFALPSLKILLAFSVMSSVCTVLNFDKLTSFILKFSKWSLTICATVFISILSLQNTLAQTADTLTMKTGKLLISASVPVIGRAISDAMSSVYSGLKLLKGTAGIALIGVIVASFLPLLAQGAAYYFVLILSSFFAEATGATRSARLFAGLSETLSLSLLFVAFFCLMTVLSTILMIVVGSG